MRPGNFFNTEKSGKLLINPGSGETHQAYCSMMTTQLCKQGTQLCVKKPISPFRHFTIDLVTGWGEVSKGFKFSHSNPVRDIRWFPLLGLKDVTIGNTL